MEAAVALNEQAAAEMDPETECEAVAAVSADTRGEVPSSSQGKCSVGFSVGSQWVLSEFSASSQWALMGSQWMFRRPSRWLRCA